MNRGVDIFHGHSAHLFQGVKQYKQELILDDTIIQTTQGLEVNLEAGKNATISSTPSL